MVRQTLRANEISSTPLGLAFLKMDRRLSMIRAFSGAEAKHQCLTGSPNPLGIQMPLAEYMRNNVSHRACARFNDSFSLGAFKPRIQRLSPLRCKEAMPFESYAWWRHSGLHLPVVGSGGATPRNALIPPPRPRAFYIGYDALPAFDIKWPGS